jgi:hypothetical protein
MRKVERGKEGEREIKCEMKEMRKRERMRKRENECAEWLCERLERMR